MSSQAKAILGKDRVKGNRQGSLSRAGAALFTAAFLLQLSLPAFFFWRKAPAVTVDSAEPGVEEPFRSPSESGTGDAPKLIALTFDDGPRRSSTTRLLNGLAERGAKATFFLIGKNVGVNRDVVQRMEEEGHQVGIHTYDHNSNLLGLNRADFAAQVDRTRALLTDVLGHGDFALRPPYGLTDAGVKTWANAPIILWSIDPEDWGDQNADREVALILKEAKDGAIILMHDIFDPTVEAALRVVDALHAQGYYFVTVDELFDLRCIALENGKEYRCAYP